MRLKGLHDHGRLARRMRWSKRRAATTPRQEAVAPGRMWSLLLPPRYRDRP